MRVAIHIIRGGGSKCPSVLSRLDRILCRVLHAFFNVFNYINFFGLFDSCDQLPEAFLKSYTRAV